MKKAPQHILVAADLSACSMAAVEYGSVLARQLGARLDVVHAWDDRIAYPAAMAAAGPPIDTVTRLGDEIRLAFEAFIERAKSAGAKVDGTLLISGPAAEVVVNAASDYDLVVVGTHGRTGIPRMLLGSVAEQVVRRAGVPVLTVRSPEEPA